MFATEVTGYVLFRRKVWYVRSIGWAPKDVAVVQDGECFGVDLEVGFGEGKGVG